MGVRNDPQPQIAGARKNALSKHENLTRQSLKVTSAEGHVCTQTGGSRYKEQRKGDVLSPHVGSS